MGIEKIDAPVLDVDRAIAVKISLQGRGERRIVANLIHYLHGKGFAVVGVDDGECMEHRDTLKDAMELVFSCDESRVYFRGVTGATYWVLLVLGNGEDIVSDYTYTTDGADGWNAAMDAFDPAGYI